MNGEEEKVCFFKRKQMLEEEIDQTTITVKTTIAVCSRAKSHFQYIVFFLKIIHYCDVTDNKKEKKKKGKREREILAGKELRCT